MADLVTKQEACDHLRLDYEIDSDGSYASSAYDGWLELFIPVVSEQVALWLKDSWRLYEWETDSDGEIVRDSDEDPVPLLDSDLNPVVRHVVKAACIIELSSLNSFREGEGMDNVVTADAGHGYILNKISTALLAALRKPTAA